MGTTNFDALELASTLTVAGAAVESAIAAATMVIAVCKTATAWAAFSLVGTTLAAVEAAA